MTVRTLLKFVTLVLVGCVLYGASFYYVSQLVSTNQDSNRVEGELGEVNSLIAQPPEQPISPLQLAKLYSNHMAKSAGLSEFSVPMKAGLPTEKLVDQLRIRDALRRRRAELILAKEKESKSSIFDWLLFLARYALPVLFGFGGWLITKFIEPPYVEAVEKYWNSRKVQGSDVLKKKNRRAA